MIKSFDELQKYGKDNLEATLKSFDSYGKNVQAIAQEITDFSKKSVDESTKTMEKLFGAKSLDNAMEIQNAYFKTAYEGFVSQATKLGTLYSELAREAYKPFEGQIAKATGAK